MKSRTLIFVDRGPANAYRFFRSVHDCVRISEWRPVPLPVFGNGSKLTDLEPISMRIERFAVQEGAYQ